MLVSEKPKTAILLLGQDRSLVETRKWILEKAGYRLYAVLTPLAGFELPITGESSPDLLLLCDSLAPEICTALLQQALQRWPAAHLVVITPHQAEAEHKPPAIDFPSYEGPAKLVALIQQLLPLTANMPLPAKQPAR